MKLKLLLVAALIAAPFTSYASATRTLDGQTITNGANTLTLPAATDTLVGKATTDTLTNKSISGSTNTLTAIPAGSALTGQVGVANGGTGASTLTTNGMVFGNGTSAVGITAAGSQYQTFQAGASGVPTVGALQLNQAAAVSGQLPVGSGGTGASTLTVHGVVLGNAASTVNVTSAGSAGQVLTSNGASADPTFQAVSVTPALNGGSGAAEAVTAGGGVTLSSIGYVNKVWVAGSGGAVTVTKTPSITVGTADGQQLTIYGTSATNTVTLQDQANLASSGMSLNGNWVGGKDSALILHWDATQSLWVEDARR